MSWIQSSLGTKISPLILFIIVVLAAVFFLAGLVHLLIRFILKNRFGQRNRGYPEMSSSGAFQRQLQQLFHLHDSGLDQAYIDALPVFMYKDIMGLKEPFDCAVCLCEFSEMDKLRLLPLCSHAFHIDCIDTWLLSNSSCPLCRGVILSPGVSYENPVFYFEDSKESDDGTSGNHHQDDISKRVFSVRLGKLKNSGGGVGGNNNNSNNSIIIDEEARGAQIGESSNSNLDARRCYSMGSFQYVVADTDELQVALSPGGRGQIGNFTSDRNGNGNGNKIINHGGKGESFSVSKVWMWSKKGNAHNYDHHPQSVNFP